jgi:hypothetical protein
MSRRSLVVLFTFVLLASAASAASAQWDKRLDTRMPPSVARALSDTPAAGGQVYRGYPRYYDPFYWGAYWGPYYTWYDWRPQLRVKVRPEKPGDDADIYIDGVRAGVGDDFDGVDQGMGFSAGAHTVVVFLEGYRTQKFDVFLREGETAKLRVELQPLGPGERSERPEMTVIRSSESGRRYR